MQKTLGQEIKDLKARKEFLLDNADKVIEMDYHKTFDSEIDAISTIAQEIPFIEV